jgi:hypothetical protein
MKWISINDRLPPAGIKTRLRYVRIKDGEIILEEEGILVRPHCDHKSCRTVFRVPEYNGCIDRSLTGRFEFLVSDKEAGLLAKVTHWVENEVE